MANTFVSNTGLFMRKYGPTVALVNGIALIGFGVFMACKATLKEDEDLSTAKEKQNSIEVRSKENDISEEEAKAEKAEIQKWIATRTIKNYIVAAGAIVGGITLVCGSHVVLNQRIGVLGTALTGLTGAFSEYRERVKEKYGDDVDMEMRFGKKETELPWDENDEGHDPNETHTVEELDDPKPGDCARVFDPTNMYWRKSPYENYVFLQSQEDALNRMIIARGHATLNDAYDLLGFPRTKDGYERGWVREEGKKADFGLRTMKKKIDELTINGVHNPNWIIDFDVDGYILDKI